MWTTGIVVVLLIVAAIAFLPKQAPLEFAYDKYPVMGKPDAPVKIVEYGDYKCPSCKVFSQQIAPQLKKDYVDKGLVSLYFADFTIIGPDSVTAALAAHSIFHQNNEAYWQFYDAIYKNQPDEKLPWATPDYLTGLVKQLNLPIDFGKLQQDIASKTYASEIDASNALARKTGVTGTPTLFINGKKFENVFDYNALKAAIDQAAKGAGQ
nr:thioredoxin domain-containing protein [Paenibacillus hamazuiensis]